LQTYFSFYFFKHLIIYDSSNNAPFELDDFGNFA
jgi:hypothetical protein